MNPQRALGPAVVLSLGLLLTYLAASGDVTSYLNPAFVPAVWVTALVLLGFATWGLVAAARGEDHGSADDAHDHDHDHDHSTMPRIGWLLLVPALLFGLLGPHPLGAFSADRTVTSRRLETIPVRTDYPVLSPTEANDIGLDELAERYLAGDVGGVDGKRVQLVGFIGLPQDDGTITLNRMKIFCCAGDGIPQTALLRDAGDLPADQWVEVRGRVERAGPLPVVVVEQVDRIEQPKDPYL